MRPAHVLHMWPYASYKFYSYILCYTVGFNIMILLLHALLLLYVHIKCNASITSRQHPNKGTSYEGNTLNRVVGGHGDSKL